MCEPNQLKRLNEEAAFASWQESEIAALKEKLRAVEAERDELKLALETERVGLKSIKMEVVDGKHVAEFTMEGSVAERITEALCVHFVEKGGENFVETSFKIHPGFNSPPGVQKMGEFYFTIQRKNGTTPGGQLSEARAQLSALRAELQRKDAALKEARLACVVRAQIAEEAISAGYAHGSGHLPTKERGADSLEKCRRDLNAALQPKEPPCPTA